jgi:catechol 2,3-dioxygenase-like lactoylglutathione lyase family enzyme
VLTGFNHLTLAVRDLSRSLHFYGEVLGFRPLAAWRTGAYLELGSLWLCLTVDEAANGAPGYTHYAFSVEASEFEAFKSRLQACGISEWKENSSEGDSLYFLDPDGNKLEAHVGDLASRLRRCRHQPYENMVFFD